MGMGWKTAPHNDFVPSVRIVNASFTNHVDVANRQFLPTIRSEGDWQWGTQSAFTIDPPSVLIGQRTKSILTGESFVSVTLFLRRLQKEVAQPWISFIKQLKLSSTLKTEQAPKRICCLKSWSLQKSELRIWKAELQSAQHFIGEARARLNEYEETSRFDQSRLEAAEKRMCELEMRARTAEGQAKDNSNTLVRIEEAIASPRILARNDYLQTN